MPIQSLIVATSSNPTAIANTAQPISLGILRVHVRNRGTGSAYLGSSSVTTGGYQLTSADSPLPLTLMPYDALWAMSTGAAVLDVLRLGDTT